MDGRIYTMPPLFHSEATGSPFTNCLECNLNLVKSGEIYVIEKAFRNYKEFELRDTVFEYALCLDCLQGLFDQFSKESRQRLENFFELHLEDHAREEERMKELEKPEVDLALWLERCRIDGTRVDEQEEFQVSAICLRDRLYLGDYPFVVGGEAIDRLIALLSNETIDFLDDFSGRHFGLPPEYDSAPDRPRMVPVLL